jgi:hypothetical protein
VHPRVGPLTREPLNRVANTWTHELARSLVNLLARSLVNLLARPLVNLLAPDPPPYTSALALSLDLMFESELPAQFVRVGVTLCCLND